MSIESFSDHVLLSTTGRLEAHAATQRAHQSVEDILVDFLEDIEQQRITPSHPQDGPVSVPKKVLGVLAGVFAVMAIAAIASGAPIDTSNLPVNTALHAGQPTTNLVATTCKAWCAKDDAPSGLGFFLFEQILLGL